MHRVTFFSIFLVFGNVQSLHLPNYITACSRSDPNFKKCAVDAANEAIPKFADGDKKYGVISVKPLFFTQLLLNTPNLNINLTNFTIRGLEDLKVTDIDIDFEKNKGKIDAVDEKMIYRGKYKVNGRILVLPIQGDGDMTMIFSECSVQFLFDIERFEKHGAEYARPKNGRVTYTVKKVEYHLENLFNGDKRLGDQLNKVLNENWEAVNKDLQGAIQQPMAEITTSILSGYFTRVPFKQIFLE